ncbi:hypothetical protein KAI04_04860 [Candidatus Pacearchaeota archaeon]|nr:hypothetical protein [Candidatus Pacearchaeota archaeon]
MTKRKLNNYEKQMTEKNLIIHKEDIEYLEEVLLPQKQLAIDTAQIVVNRQIRELKTEVSMFNKKLSELKSIVEVGENQILHGVDIKESKGGKK